MNHSTTTADSAVPLRALVHLTEQGSMVRVNGSRLIVQKDDKRLLDVPIHKLSGLLVYGAIQVTTPAVAALLEEGIWVAFLSRHGRYRGRLQPLHSRSSVLRMRQFECFGDPDFRTRFVRAVIRAKLMAQLNLIRNYSRNYVGEVFSSDYGTIRTAIEKIDSLEIEELRGWEGTSTRSFFAAFSRFNRSDFDFERRTRRPPADPINALLSLGYTLLTREMEALLEAAGFDPCVGFYHTFQADRASLACDLVEEFRHSVVDRLILKLVNYGTIRADDFEDTDKGLRLTRAGLLKFLSAYENAMIGNSEDSASQSRARTMIIRQTARLYDTVMSGVPYLPSDSGNSQ